MQCNILKAHGLRKVLHPTKLQVKNHQAEAAKHPRTALLVIEVADSSARRDLEVKARIYARAGVPEYWLVLVKQRAIAVLRDPDAVAGSYRNQVVVSSDSTLTPSAFAGPDVVLRTLFD